MLDRDGVLNEDTHLLSRRRDLRLLTGVAEALNSLRASGFKLIVISNQPIVARGLASEPLDAFYYCPHHPSATLASYRIVCECRKPRPGMLLRAAAEHHLDLSASFMVGDRITDVIAGAHAGCRTIQVRTGRHEAPPIETVGPLDEDVRPDHVCSGLPEAARWILSRTRP